MKFPGLESNSTYANLHYSQIEEITLFMYQYDSGPDPADMYLNQYTGASWMPSTASYANPNTVTGAYVGGAYIDYTGLCYFDLTNRAQAWKEDPTAFDKGIIIRNLYDTVNDYSSYKSFLSTQSSWNRPYLSIAYDDTPKPTIELERDSQPATKLRARRRNYRQGQYV